MGQSIYANVRSLLKENTAALHLRAETAFESKARLESPEGLRNFLSCMLNAHQHFGVQYDRASCLAGLEPQAEKLITALQLDLNLVAACTIPSDSCNEHFSLGVGYVFEGSALGAQIIKKRLSIVGVQNLEYLNIVTSTAKARWPRYVEKLNDYKGADDILPGAVAAFNFIIDQAESSR